MHSHSDTTAISCTSFCTSTVAVNISHRGSRSPGCPATQLSPFWVGCVQCAWARHHHIVLARLTGCSRTCCANRALPGAAIHAVQIKQLGQPQGFRVRHTLLSLLPAVLECRNGIPRYHSCMMVMFCPDCLVMDRDLLLEPQWAVPARSFCLGSPSVAQKCI